MKRRPYEALIRQRTSCGELTSWNVPDLETLIGRATNQERAIWAKLKATYSPLMRDPDFRIDEPPDYLATRNLNQ
jgi:hypothetical protein